MPGVKSLVAGEYYAHKHNAFWQIMGELLDAGWEKPYGERVRILNDKGIAVWDVLQSCIRPGSLDLDIREEEPNDFQSFFKVHPHIQKVGLNGGKAASCFKKFASGFFPAQTRVVRLPSTSRANARLSFAEKRDAWRTFMLS